MMKERARLLIVSCDNVSRHSYEDAYAHPEVTGAKLSSKSTYPYTWGDVDTWDDYDRKAPIVTFRLRSQVDSRDDISPDGWPYGIKYGFRADDNDMIQHDDVTRYAKTLAAIDKGMRREHDDNGAAGSFGAYVLRLARLLRADAIVMMPARPWYSTTDTTAVYSMTDRPGRVVAHIDDMVRKARIACKRAVGKETAES